MRLLLIGCTGFIGRELVPYLLQAGHEVTIVSRKSANRSPVYKYLQNSIYINKNPSEPAFWESEEIQKVLEKTEGIINLAGEPIAEKRWTNSHCQILLKSRLDTTKGLIKAISLLKIPPKILINASAIGFYGTSKKQQFTEENSNGNDFLAKLCKEWEKIASQKPRATRLLILRIGIVLGKDGGALGKMLPIFKAGFGGPLGDGKQWMSWIHRSDLCQIIEQSIKNKSWSGVINSVAPNPVSMGEFSETLGKVLGRPSLLPIPGKLLELLLGDGAKVVLEGQCVKPMRLNKLGFQFQYKTISEALLNINKKA